MKYFIANWKARKNLLQINDWLKIFTEEVNQNPQLLLKLTNSQVRIILCPPFPLLIQVKNNLPDLPNIFVGSQDLSQFDEGSYTGEVNAKALTDFARYSIIGHSERRKYFQENDSLLAKKLQMAQQYNIEPIYCIRDEKDFLPHDSKLIAYEPIAAIGTGQNEAPEKVVEMKKRLKMSPSQIFIYGGSVDEKNAQAYLNTKEIDGFLIGTASLNPKQFYKIVRLG